VVGSGSAGKRHYSYACKNFPQAEVFCLSFNDIPFFSSNNFQNFSDAKKFDANLVIIANASIKHLSALKLLISETAYYVIEKPLSAAPAKREITNELAKVLEDKVILAYQLRFSQSLNRLKSELNSGKIGKILFGNMCTGQYLPDWRKGSDYRTGVSARRELGGGVLNELSHEVDLIFWLFGLPLLRDVQIQKRSNLDINVEDFVRINTFQNKSEFSNAWPLNLSLDMIRRDPVRIVEVVGEHGTLKWDGILGTLDYFEPSTNDWTLLFKDDSHPHDLLWEGITNFVKTGSHDGANLDDGIKVVDFIDEIWRANQFRVEGL